MDVLNATSSKRIDARILLRLIDKDFATFYNYTFSVDILNFKLDYAWIRSLDEIYVQVSVKMTSGETSRCLSVAAGLGRMEVGGKELVKGEKMNLPRLGKISLN